MANVSMSGKGRLTNHTACEAAYGISNPESKKQSLIKRLKTFIKVILFQA